MLYFFPLILHRTIERGFEFLALINSLVLSCVSPLSSKNESACMIQFHFELLPADKDSRKGDLFLFLRYAG